MGLGGLCGLQIRPAQESRALVEAGKELLERQALALIIGQLEINRRAIVLFDAAIEAAPESLEARYQRALAYLASDQPDAAISVLTQAIRLDPDVADYWYQRWAVRGAAQRPHHGDRRR